jgi:hypothetical protein
VLLLNLKNFWIIFYSPSISKNKGIKTILKKKIIAIVQAFLIQGKQPFKKNSQNQVKA